MRERRSLAIRTYELDASDRHRPGDAGRICHGQGPHSRHGHRADDGEPMSFSLHLADGGSLLVLYREGYLPQAIRVNEVVADWLQALASDEGLPAPTEDSRA